MDESNKRFEWKETSDGSFTLFDHLVKQSFKSEHAAHTETWEVFLRPGILENPIFKKSEPFHILELGFGLGTNLLSLIELASQNNEKQFIFHSIDHDFSGARFFAKEKNEKLFQWVFEKKFSPLPNLHCELLEGKFEQVLNNIFGNVSNATRYHAIFFDPFSPTINPDEWTAEIFKKCFQLLVPKGRLLTYSVSRIAKDGAQNAGFLVEKRNLPKILNKKASLLAIKA